ncbi:zinc finger protein [Macleaya cordata]|uniref:Zinc finger protein n=1 Tax=Macleaya cordata TaxID=56857 RepID=A0A200QY38_MACCD|nr:zinc finger protein [Macleaya cordata]
MSEIGETSVLGLQESVERERKARTLLDFLSEDMDTAERGGGRWRNLKERLGFKGMGCCGATWRSNATSNLMREEAEYVQSMGMGQIPISIPIPAENSMNQDCVGQIPAVDSGMNLATALAAERNFRAAEGGRGGLTGTTVSTPSTPLRVSLMRLLQEGDGLDGEREKERERVVLEGGSNDTVCCVCMERRKGAAFIPCGHTFCRVCTRDIWLNRGSCAICNRSIVEILDIF